MRVLKDKQILREGLSNLSHKMPSCASGLPAGSSVLNNYSTGCVSYVSGASNKSDVCIYIFLKYEERHAEMDQSLHTPPS